MFGLTAFQDIINLTVTIDIYLNHNDTDHPEKLSSGLVPSLSKPCCCEPRRSLCHSAGLYTHMHLAQRQGTRIMSCVDLPKEFFLVSVLPFLQQTLKQQ